ncbi:putative pentatricopeptide repeat-containing protein At3g49142 [Selaginella moellendorffii]|uniref:putative pentatricopeptide repeat-containing protein At3g49142 n=1 Tax=Selaginella moellendorffii TaxID=88036 RepID=UPI000D1CE8A8|nr:putative pentatricopeptide repeat-containing protein At3g49142 [Selaginella moellendorffii]|eukprot:XP_024537486.1 putative pentatricopeptide repeat-containing protein At3g49142 [Selaginella moellendorffii]
MRYLSRRSSRRSWRWIALRFYHNAAVCEIVVGSRQDEAEASSVFSVLAALRSCASAKNLERGKRVHAQAMERGYDSNVFVANSLVNMYAKCGSLVEARRVFDRIQSRDVISWNSLLLGYASQGEEDAALKLFSRMESSGCSPNGGSYIAALKACIRLAGKEEGTAQADGRLVKIASLGKGIAIHTQASKAGWESDIFVASTLVDFYAKCGHMTEASRIFSRMSHHDVVSWTTLILGYAENGEGDVALEHFFRMIAQCCQPNALTCVAALKACMTLAAKEQGRLVTGKVVKLESLGKGMAVHREASKLGCDTHTFVSNSLVDMYSKCGSMADAHRVFSWMPCHSVVSWTSLILGYVENGDAEMALAVYSSMRPEACAPDARTFVAALKAINELAAKEQGELVDGKLVKLECLKKGMRIHSQAEGSGCADYFFINTLVDLYAKCGSLADAHRVFDSIPSQTSVSWTTLLLGYAENGEGEMALELFRRMRPRGCEPDARTFAAVLKACGSVLALENAKAICGEVCRGGYENDVILSNTMVDALARCGSLDAAQRVFDVSIAKDIVLWTTLIAGYSRQGEASQVFHLFHEILDEGFKADSVTLLCVLAVCSYAGLVDKGRGLFSSMASRYGVSPGFEHHHCMLDILCRANQLDAAVQLIRSMPFEPTAVTWRTVLGACRKWKNVVLGELAFANLLKLDDSEFGVYILMEQIYWSLGMWEEHARIETMRISAGAWRKPGQGRSWWTDSAGVVHKFSAGDSSHAQIDEIRAKLDDLLVAMKEQGYVADVGSVLRSTSDEDKEDVLCGHSERLAIACALINTAPGATVRIVKNLRTCDDCHRATCMISRIEERRILCRETNRFHVFEDGRCCCGGYW